MITVYDYLKEYQPEIIVTIIAAKPSKNKYKKNIKVDYFANLEDQNVLPYGFDA